MTLGIIAPGQNGIVGNGMADDAAAINAVIAAFDEIKIERGVYAVASPLLLPLSAGKNFRVHGSGSVDCVLLAKRAFTGDSAVILDGGGGVAITDFVLEDFMIRNEVAGQGPKNGLSVGAFSGGFEEGFSASKIDGLTVQGFAVNFNVSDSYMVKWDRCSSWKGDNQGGSTVGGIGWKLTARGGANSFTGNHGFTNSQVEADPTGTGVLLTDEGRPGVSIAGNSWDQSDWYGGARQFQISLTGRGSSIGDVWIGGTRAQFEGTGTNTAIQVDASGPGSFVANLHIDGCYMVGAGFDRHINMHASNGCDLRNIFINNNLLSSSRNESIMIISDGPISRGFTILGNQFAVINAPQSLIAYLSGLTYVNFSNNLALRYGSDVRQALFKFGAPCEWIAAANNNSGGCCVVPFQNTSGAMHAAITGNI